MLCARVLILGLYDTLTKSLKIWEIARNLRINLINLIEM